MAVPISPATSSVHDQTSRITPASAPATAAPQPVSWHEALRTWSRVAALSFGGPAGQIAVMHRILVDEKRWISDERFLHALNYCMLLPGPEAQQLATYVGWLMHRTRGGLMAGLLFILPGIVSIMALSLIYASFGNTGIVAGLFFGLKAAVLAIVVEAVVRIGRRALKNRIMIGLAGLAFAAIFLFGVPFPIIVLGAGLLGYVGAKVGVASLMVEGGQSGHGGANAARADDGDRPPAIIDALLGAGRPDHTCPTWARSVRTLIVWAAIWLTPVAALLILRGRTDVFSQIAIFFSEMAVVTFGGAYAVLAYVAQQAVQNYHWVTAGQMLDGLGMAETTPGPLIMVLQFVGFMAAFHDHGTLPPLLAGALGGLLATWVTFAPCFLWIFFGAPFIETLRGNKALSAALSAITAAVVGVILNLALWFAIHTLFREVMPFRSFGLAVDAPALGSVNVAAMLLAIACALAIFYGRVGMLTTLAAAAFIGLALHFVGLA